MKTLGLFTDLSPLIDQEVAVSDWTDVTQQHIDLFAQATGDHQWIHVDEERARAGPYGTTIAHGFLTVALLPRMFASALCFEGQRRSVNYGLNQVRFPAPVPAGSRVRCRIRLLDYERLEPRELRLTWRVIVEREGADKPVCVAEALQRRYF